MKQKVTIYHVGVDGRSGTQSYAFANEEAVKQFQRETIESELDGTSADIEDVQAIRLHIQNGAIDEAWTIYEDQIKDSLDSYNFDQSEIDVDVTIPREAIKELAMRLVYGGKFSFDTPLPRAEDVADFIDKFLGFKREEA